MTPYLPVLPAALGLHLSSLYSYLLFHTIVEMGRVVVLFSVFVLAWHSRRLSNNNYIVWIGISFLFVGALDFVHAMAYQGIGIFPSADANLPTQLYIGLRYLEGLSLIAAGFVAGKRFNPNIVFAAYALVTLALGSAIFGGMFPDCYVEGSGLTSFKIVSEYILSALFLAAIVPLIRLRLFEPDILRLLAGSFAVSAAAEIAFTRYVSVDGTANEIGHLLLLLSSYFLYRAVLVTGILNPYAVLFRNLQIDIDQRLQAEEQLRKSEEEFRAFFNTAAVGAVQLAPDGRFLKVNERFCQITGYGRDELAGMTPLDLTHPDDRPHDEENLAAFLAGRAPILFSEKRFVRKDGRIVWVEVTAAMVRDDAGRPLRTAGVIQDITERKQVEAALRESEEQFHTLADAIPQLAWMANADGWIYWYNRRWYEYTGTTPDRMEGWGWQSVHDPKALPAVLERWRASIATGEPFDMVFPLRGADGAFRPFLTRIQPVRNAERRVVRWFGTNTDVHELTRAEEALRKSEARLKKVLDNETVGVMFWDLTTGCMTDANDTFLNMMGYSRREVEARELTWQKLTPPEYVEVSMAEIGKFHATGRIGPYEKEYFRKDGTRRWLIFAGSSLGDNACVEFCVDIADRKAAENALRDSQARLQSEAAALARLNDASSRLWAIRDLKAGLGEVLAAAIDLLGADMGHVQLLNAERGVLEIAVHRGFKQDFLVFFREVSTSENTSSGRALRLHQRVVIDDVENDPAYRPVARAAGYRAVQSTPLIGHDGAPLGMISTHFRSVHRPSEEELRRLDLYARQAADFIERYRMDEALRRAEEQRQTLQAELLRASRLSEIGRMTAALAHELNQPLTSVTSYIGGCRRMLRNLAAEEGPKQKLQDIMEQVNAQALRAGEIIRRLREFIGTGQGELRIENAASVISEGTTLAFTSARHDGVLIDCDIQASANVLVDRIQIQQVIFNLVRNAIEAMEATRRKELGIRTTVKGELVEFSVSDTGAGIAAEIAGRLFKPFSTTKDHGMGIGLSVCREIIEAHEGKIWCEPNPDGGTIFRFTLPVVRGETVADVTAGRAAGGREKS